MSLVIVSPHLDDAVFSCGTLIAATALHHPVIVVTVCAGLPDPDVLAPLDHAAGFTSSVEAVEKRREEDLAAANLLGYAAIHLDCLDGQYSTSSLAARVSSMSVEIENTLGRFRGGQRIVAPVGLRHPDHQAVAAVCAPWAALLYEELPYRVLWPETRPDGLGEPALELPSCAAKAKAIECYRSQLGDGPAGPELAENERYHRVR